jgi:hypothetical protein
MGANWTADVNNVHKIGRRVWLNIEAYAANTSASWGYIAALPAGYWPNDFINFLGFIQGDTLGYKVGLYYVVAVSGILATSLYDDGTTLASVPNVVAGDRVHCHVSYLVP